MNFFANAKTEEEAKTRYRSLCKIYHPDAGIEPDGELFIEIDKQYRQHLKDLANPKEKDTNKQSDERTESTEPPTTDSVELDIRIPKLTPKQKKHLKKGAGLIFSVIADKVIEKYI